MKRKDKIIWKTPLETLYAAWTSTQRAAGQSEYKGQVYYFCSLGCKKSFDKDPEKYLGGGEHEQHHH